MDYATDYDVGDRKRGGGINEDSVAISVFEEGHRDGLQREGSTSEQPDSPSASDDPKSNEDAATTRNRSAAAVALADGAGGHDAGDVASYLATTTVCEQLAEVAVRAATADSDAFGVDVPDDVSPAAPTNRELLAAIETAIVEAHRAILRYGAATGRAAHTTIVAGLWCNGQFHYGWVGDSRAYLVNTDLGRIERLTEDHSVVEELGAQGAIDEIEAQVHPRSNEITRAIGGAADGDPADASVPVETRSVPVYAEDVLLLTSDGLLDAQTDAPALYDRYVDSGRDEAIGEAVWDAVVTDDEIREYVLAASDFQSLTTDLIEMANDRGGKDNISLLVAQDDALAPTPAALDTRAIEPDDIVDRETVLIPEDS